VADESGTLRKRQGSLKRIIPLSQLLARQPLSLRKHPLYDEMMQHYYLSDSLKSLRISRRCYSLLNRAVIAPENLVHFYRTYRLPKDPFFPLFFMIKRDLLKEKERKAAEKEAYILSEMKKLPPVRRRMIRFLAEWEMTLNRQYGHPLWEESLYPRTKKRVRELLDPKESDWQDLMRVHVENLKTRYPAIRKKDADLVSACLTLGLVPSVSPLQIPSRQEINKAYRSLSRLHHPDSGGEDRLFIELAESRNLLLSSL